MKAIEGARCPQCGGPLTYEAFEYVAQDGRVVLSIPSADRLALCVRCVALFLCKAALLHSDLRHRMASEKGANWLGRGRARCRVE